jgi:hypothetical protein
MRFLFTLMGGLFFAATPVFAVRFVDVEAKYLDSGYFKHFAEYFTGNEVQGDRLVLRSVLEERAGFYFVCAFDDAPVAGQNIQIEYIPQGSNKVKSYTFEIGQNPGLFTDVFAGLTGKDWPGEEVPMMAWKISLLNRQGTLLAEKKSFAWEMPRK